VVDSKLLKHIARRWQFHEEADLDSAVYIALVSAGIRSPNTSVNISAKQE